MKKLSFTVSIENDESRILNYLMYLEITRSQITDKKIAAIFTATIESLKPVYCLNFGVSEKEYEHTRNVYLTESAKALGQMLEENKQRIKNVAGKIVDKL